MAKEDKREAILQATLELVTEHGFHDAPCSLIAKQAGVAAGTIYRYFDNKDVLINELFFALEQRITQALLEGYAAQGPLRQRFIHLVTGILTYFISHPLEFRYIEQFHNSPYGAKIRRDRLLGTDSDEIANNGCALYRQLFIQGIEQEVIKDFPLPIIFDLAFGPIVSVARNHILGFIQLDQVLLEQVAAACWDGLKRH